MERFSFAMPVRRVLANTPAAHGIVGLTTRLVPSLTLGCRTFGGNSTTDNVTYSHLLNIKQLAEGRPTSLDVRGLDDFALLTNQKFAEFETFSQLKVVSN